MATSTQESPCTASQFDIRLPATPLGAGRARRIAVDRIASWGLPTDGPGLIVAELAANAVTHGRVPGRDLRVLLTLTGEALRIEVVDTRRDRVPRVRDADPDAEGGRGLLVVAELADRWGVRQGTAPLKAVWAEVDVVRPGP
ncbi:ATP-binding protein [Streptomyces sp. NPDC006687]|uniref:ATP-binding protein n=1 Tax=unclassified Streptomyces TaxID=2593676 RepID=UPI003405C293